MNNGGTPPPSDPDAGSAEDKRRLIVSKISTRMLEQMVLTRHKPSPDTRTREALPTNRFTYQMIAQNGEKITAHMEIEDPGFLINQMDLTPPQP